MATRRRVLEPALRIVNFQGNFSRGGSYLLEDRRVAREVLSFMEVYLQDQGW